MIRLNTWGGHTLDAWQCGHACEALRCFIGDFASKCVKHNLILPRVLDKTKIIFRTNLFCYRACPKGQEVAAWPCTSYLP